jgi:Ca2+-binding RTX toxin-like protein
MHGAHGQSFSLTSGADSIQGTAGNDTIIAVAGSLSAGDSINGGGGKNLLQLFGAGSFDLSQPAALRHISVVQGANEAQAVTLSGSANLVFRGGNGDSVITSLAGNDSIATGAGNTTVHGGSGNDLITAGSGADLIFAGSGHATVRGGSGNDTINGGDGGDRIAAGSGNTIIVGGAGKDTIEAGIGNDSVTLGGGTDVLKLAYSEHAAGTILVADFTHGSDRIDAGQFAHNFRDLQAHSTITGSAGGLVIQIADGPTITLVGATTVTGSDFVFWGHPHG